jgi:hypothetical protein
MKDWQRHEDHVAALYRALGFEVTPNVSVDGQQVDLLCEKFIAGIGRAILYVDCKHTHLTENKSISKDDVDQFIYTFRSRNEKNLWTNGVMVSNRPFTQQAKAAARPHPLISLKTIDELHEEILHIRPYLHEAVRRYKETAQFSDFIPPYGSSHDSGQSPTNPLLLDTHFRNWLKDDSCQQLCLFGDFGTGKTTYLEFLHFSIARKYLADSSVRIPLLIPLRRFYEAPNHEELIRQFFLQECGVNIQYALFQDFLEKGRLLLLLDGFDEMGAKSDPIIRKSNYLKLAPLAEGASKIVISCRPAYFISGSEMTSVFALVKKQVGFSPPAKPSPLSQHLYALVRDSDLAATFSRARSSLRETRYLDISLFNKRQITAYLNKHNKEIVKASRGQLNARTLFERIEEIYDLEDLAQRPILLKLIVKTLPSFQCIDSGKYQIAIGSAVQTVPDITPSALYDVYTQRELAREHDDKGGARSLVDRQTKVRIIAAVAFQMFRSNELTLERAELSEIIQQTLSPDQSEEAYFSADIATCSFLTRDLHGALRFTHKSFMEYYAAVWIRLRMSSIQSIQELLSTKLLDDEIALFLGDSISVAADADAIMGRLHELYENLSEVNSPSDACIQNTLNVLNYARMPVSPLRKIRTNTLVYRKLEISEQAFEELRVDILRTIKLQATKWHIVNSEIKRWEAQSSVIKELKAENSEVKGMRFWDTSIEKLEVLHGGIQIETWRRSKIQTATLADLVVLNNGLVDAGWLPEQGYLEDCILVGLDLRSQALCNLQFKRCVFIKCKADRALRKEVVMENCKGVLVTEGPGGIQDWGYGVSCCSAAATKAFHKKDLGPSPTWQELLLSSFDGDPSKLARSTDEVKAKLSQIDLGMQLNRHIGDIALVVGGRADKHQCRIVKCNAHRLTLYNLTTSAEVNHPLAKTVIEARKPLVIRLEGN